MNRLKVFLGLLIFPYVYVYQRLTGYKRNPSSIGDSLLLITFIITASAQFLFAGLALFLFSLTRYLFSF